MGRRPLTVTFPTGEICVFDDEDAPLVTPYRWYRDKDGYARTGRQDGNLRMHRLILGNPASQVDHRDGDPLNNRRSNLRLATVTQNRQNVRWRSKRGPIHSRFKGVLWQRRYGRGVDGWVAVIHVNGKSVRRVAATEEDAARRYNALAQQYFGEFACLNVL